VPQRHVEQVQDESAVPSAFKVPPNRFRRDPEEDLSALDFAAAAEMLTNVGGIATWSGIRGGSEYRNPLDTHIQILPFPVHSAGDNSPLRFPLELYIDRAIREGSKAQDEPLVGIFQFQHHLIPLPEANSKAELSKAMADAYEDARENYRGTARGEGVLLAFTTAWLLVVPVMPPDVSSAAHEAWLRLPPPPPCALCGVLVCGPLEPDFPETAGQNMEDLPLVTTRADQEAIPEGTPEWEAASREVRIATRILDCPAEYLGIWALSYKQEEEDGGQGVQA